MTHWDLAPRRSAPGAALALALLALAGLAACGQEAPRQQAVADMRAPAALPPYDPHAFDAMEEGVIRLYLQAQDALVHDELDGARQALTAIGSRADGEVATLARAAAGAAGLAAVRQAFAPLSEALIRTDLPGGLAVAYCPMALNHRGAYWIQRTGEIANPYYGARMLRCGVFEDPEAGDSRQGG
ncbi:MAG: hypothetical protein ABIL09_07070 [Gemmatimonadota bacterium]